LHDAVSDFQKKYDLAVTAKLLCGCNAIANATWREVGARQEQGTHLPCLQHTLAQGWGMAGGLERGFGLVGERGRGWGKERG
jgi:hypothetical protein